MSPLPIYAWLGLATMVVSETGMLLRIEPFWSWHTPIVWTGYILFVDGLVWKRRGDSWLSRAPREFVFLAIVSVPLWLVFEFYNLFIRNWHYVNLPEHPLWRSAGYAWSFATIWPALFETGELIATLRNRRVILGKPSDVRAEPVDAVRPEPVEGSNGAQDRRRLTRAETISIAAGTGLLLWPLVQPSPYLAAPVWLGFIFLLDPINARLGGQSLAADLGRGRHDRIVNLAIAGEVCGLLWEFWNYGARARWVYAVPILPELKLFEMPLPGYLGFPAFALECFTMYVTVRLLLWRGPGRTISL